MSTAGPNGPGGASGTANGGQAWTTITNVTADDSSYATVAVTAAVFSEYMFTNTFGFAIPSTATINGIQVDLKAKVSTTSANVNLTLSKNGGASGSTSFNTPQVTTTEAFKSYGSSSELWGLTWTPTEVNASTFGFRLWVGQDTNNTWSVNYGRITVTYTPAFGGPSITVTRQAVMRAATR